MKTANESFLNGFEFARKFHSRVTPREILGMSPEENTNAYLEGIEDALAKDYTRFDKILREP